MSNYRELIMLVTSDQLAAMLSKEKGKKIPASSIFNSIPGKKGIVVTTRNHNRLVLKSSAF